MFAHSTEIRVRYGETDQMGFVYYGNYALYYEVGRVEAIRSLGITYRELEDAGILMPVIRLEIKYIRAAEYDDLLTVESRIEEMPDRLITFKVNIRTTEGSIINQATVVLCFRDKANGKLIRTPSLITNQLGPYFDK